MKTYLVPVFVFIAGVSTGWFAKTWTGSGPLLNPAVSTDTTDVTATNADGYSQQSSSTTLSTDLQISSWNPAGDSNQQQQQPTTQRTDNSSIIDKFNRLLASRQYDDAMLLYQEQKQRSESTAAQLRQSLLDKLTRLSESRSNGDFSELIESYLSIYYDDIDVLLLLADFNHANNSYLEVIDVYLLAKTYAYTDFETGKIASRFDQFVDTIDSSYTSEGDWWSLINFYSHIRSSGLMTSTHQYQQAIAHLRSGDKAYAIEQLNELLGDNLMGESAAQALNDLSTTSEARPAITRSVPQDAESVALRKQGNQYFVNLTNNQQGSVQLLIDTGASMTAVSSNAFNVLNTNGDAVAQERRVFHTAGGVVMGTVFSFPELILGPYLIKNTKIAVIDFDSNPHIDGLLGMNILGQFRFQIDQENSRLLLNRD